MRSRRSRRSLKVSHTQTSVPCGMLNNISADIAVLGKLQALTAMLQVDENTCILANNHDNTYTQSKWHYNSLLVYFRCYLQESIISTFRLTLKSYINFFSQRQIGNNSLRNRHVEVLTDTPI